MIYFYLLLKQLLLLVLTAYYTYNVIIVKIFKFIPVLYFFW